MTAPPNYGTMYLDEKEEPKMNLQLVSPYVKCPFACPFCVAAISDKSPYCDDVYTANKDEYLRRLIMIINEHNIETVVITGDTEPTLFPEWLEEVLSVLTQMDVKIEIQTRNYKFKGDNRYDVVAYSFDKAPEKIIQSNGKQTRAVFINNKNLNLTTVLAYKANSQHQVTFKQMQKTAYGIPSIDKYIDKVYKPIHDLDRIYLAESRIHYDENCMASEGRYIIYRCDGNIYQTWSEPPKKVF